MNLSPRSESNLAGVNPKLVAIVRRAAEMAPLPGELGFIVTEGVRTLERQKQLVACGASRTMQSRHLTGHAVDLAATVAGQVRWDWPLYGQLAAIMKAAAVELKTPITWGGDWKSFRDGPHYQIEV